MHKCVHLYIKWIKIVCGSYISNNIVPIREKKSVCSDWLRIRTSVHKCTYIYIRLLVDNDNRDTKGKNAPYEKRTELKWKLKTKGIEINVFGKEDKRARGFSDKVTLCYSCIYGYTNVHIKAYTHSVWLFWEKKHGRSLLFYNK